MTLAGSAVSHDAPLPSPLISSTGCGLATSWARYAASGVAVSGRACGLVAGCFGAVVLAFLGEAGELLGEVWDGIAGTQIFA
jgi:hypothetical protein